MENPYITPTRVRAALRALELRPTRGMGQNFLIDSDALGAIVGIIVMLYAYVFPHLVPHGLTFIH